MGISWTAEVVSFVLDGSFYSWFLTDLINSLIGFIIFVNFVCKARIVTLLIHHCPCLNKLSSIEFIRKRLMADPHRSSCQTTATISTVQKLRSNSRQSSSKSSSIHRNVNEQQQLQLWNNQSILYTLSASVFLILLIDCFPRFFKYLRCYDIA